jgi:hypothetical protein
MKKKTKNILVAVVALVLLLAMAFSFSYGNQGVPGGRQSAEKERASVPRAEGGSKETYSDSGLPAGEARKRETLSGSKLLQNVPFMIQAPLGDWKDPRQQHGCEEASLAMAAAWVQGKELTAETALAEIFALTDFERKNYGEYYDLSLADTLRLWQDYYHLSPARAEYDVTKEDIRQELAAGRLVIAPMNGTLLHNPHYTAPGPLYHQLVIIGFDDAKRVFITNDPGTRFGKGYAYDYDIFMKALRDFRTGNDLPVTGEVKAILVIGKPE